MNKAQMRCRIIMLSWFVATIGLGVGIPLIVEAILGLSFTFGMFSVFARGDIFVADAVIAADALGRAYKSYRLKECKIEIRFFRKWGLPSAVASLFALIINVVYFAKVVIFRETTSGRVLPPFALESLLWFGVTAIIAGLTVSGTDAMTTTKQTG